MFIHAYNLVCYVCFQYKREITCQINVIQNITNCYTKKIHKKLIFLNQLYFYRLFQSFKFLYVDD